MWGEKSNKVKLVCLGQHSIRKTLEKKVITARKDAARTVLSKHERKGDHVMRFLNIRSRSVN